MQVDRNEGNKCPDALSLNLMGLDGSHNQNIYPNRRSNLINAALLARCAEPDSSGERLQRFPTMRFTVNVLSSPRGNLPFSDSTIN